MSKENNEKNLLIALLFFFLSFICKINYKFYFLDDMDLKKRESVNLFGLVKKLKCKTSNYMFY